jgi:hypothetical protein
MNDNPSFYANKSDLPPISAEQLAAVTAAEVPSQEFEASSAVQDVAIQESVDRPEAPEPEQRRTESSDAERNFSELRKEKYRIAQERDEYARKLAQYESALLQSTKPQSEQIPVEDDDIVIGDEDVAEGKHVRKILKKYKKLEEELNKFKNRSAEELVETRIRARHPDYDLVVNSETLKMLATDDPELVNTIYSSPDVYNKALLAYKEIKRRGIVPSETYDTDKKRIQDNVSKPRPITSVTPRSSNTGPLSHANAFSEGLTDSLKAQLWKEMKEAMKN